MHSDEQMDQMGHSAIPLLTASYATSTVHDALDLQSTKITNSNTHTSLCSSAVTFLIIRSLLGVLGSFITSVIN